MWKGEILKQNVFVINSKKSFSALKLIQEKLGKEEENWVKLNWFSLPLRDLNYLKFPQILEFFSNHFNLDLRIINSGSSFQWFITESFSIKSFINWPTLTSSKNNIFNNFFSTESWKLKLTKFIQISNILKLQSILIKNFRLPIQF